MSDHFHVAKGKKHNRVVAPGIAVPDGWSLHHVCALPYVHSVETGWCQHGDPRPDPGYCIGGNGGPCEGGVVKPYIPRGIKETSLPSEQVNLGGCHELA